MQLKKCFKTIINNTTTPNTDNKGHLFVTVFEHTAFLYCDPHIAQPGHRTSALNKNSVP